jgi:septation ring formation regulator EzrA
MATLRVTETDREKIIHIQGKIDNLDTKLDLSLKNITDKIEAGTVATAVQLGTVNQNISTFLVQNNKLQDRISKLEERNIKNEESKRTLAENTLELSRKVEGRQVTIYYRVAIISSVLSLILYVVYNFILFHRL